MNNKKQTDENGNLLTYWGNDSINKVVIPLQLIWQPIEDITVFELAQCLPYLLRFMPLMPHELDKTKSFFRHFEIIDHNL
jgi:hypothetical protein